MESRDSYDIRNEELDDIVNGEKGGSRAQPRSAVRVREPYFRAPFVTNQGHYADLQPAPAAPTLSSLVGIPRLQQQAINQSRSRSPPPSNKPTFGVGSPEAEAPVEKKPRFALPAEHQDDREPRLPRHGTSTTQFLDVEDAHDATEPPSSSPPVDDEEHDTRKPHFVLTPEQEAEHRPKLQRHATPFPMPRSSSEESGVAEMLTSPEPNGSSQNFEEHDPSENRQFNSEYTDRRHSSPASALRPKQARPADPNWQSRPEEDSDNLDVRVRETSHSPPPPQSPDSSNQAKIIYPSSKRPASEMACQVEDDELLSKTISTQCSESDFSRHMAPSNRSASHAHFKLEEDKSHKSDFVDVPLKTTPSSAHLHGILRKAPSAKFGSQMIERDPSASSSMDEEKGDKDDKQKRSSIASSNGNAPLTKEKRSSSIGQKLAKFHLGGHHSHDDEDASSLHGKMPDVKHASFAKLPVDTSGSEKGDKDKNKETVPWYRKCLPGKKKGMGARSFTMDDLKKDLSMDEHLVPQEELFNKLDVDPKTGLSDEEAAKRLQRDGPNALTPPKEIPEIIKILKEFVGGFSPLLEIGAALCFIAFGIQVGTQDDAPYDNLYLGIVLICVVLITGGFLYLQKRKSEQIMDGFKKMLPQSANVVRNGKVKEIAADAVVTGDIVEIKGGDRIPADCRVLEAKTLKVDNSSLTGESEPQSRSPEGSENPLESKNLVFYTSNAVEGWCRGIVIKRGDNTVMGRIAKLTTRIGQSETTIAKEMHHFVILICVLAITMGILCIIVALALGYDGFYAVILAIGLVVANVPEGIIITVTVMLTLTAQRMAKKNCLIKNLEAVETLGACSVICSDKTGTLTQNRMTVAHLWVDDSIVAADTSHDTLADLTETLPQTQTCQDLLRVATLCNRAKFKDDQMDKPVYSRECKGDASESAILKYTEILQGDVMALREKNKAVAEIPFNSTTKYQVSIHEVEVDGRIRNLLVMKGAPERIWDRCATIGANDQGFSKDEEWDKKFNDAYLDLGSRGERVLGFCDLLLPEDKFPQGTPFDTEKINFPDEGLRFLGLISLIDPPRPSVPDGVAKCRSAGIQVIMVTGDHPVTAKAIARSVGIISEGVETVEDIAQRTGVDVKQVNPRDAQAIVIHGGALKDMNDNEIDDVLMNHTEIVFARTSPQQKLIIVEACQRAGAVVAVTGDGVNDSPALKKADIGIAMGITGSDVSKQAADIVLLDDNFASIVTGVEEGRLIFDNLKKTICYTLMSNIPEIAPVVIYFLLSVPLGLGTIPMLLVCLGTDMIPSISMAHESAEADIMKLPPRNADERLVGARLLHCCYLQAGMICSAGAFFAYFVCLGECGFRPYRVVGVRDEWENKALNDVEDSYGQEWTYTQRMYMQRTLGATFFAAIVVFQWADLICRKCRRKSVIQKGMKNWFLNFALVFETAVAIFCIYVPGLNYALSLYTIRFVWWLPVLPFVLYFFVFDELRRLLIRRYPDGWWDREFYF